MVMYENQKWLPVASLFGLLGCAIPRPLKADILHTLAAFARSPEVAAPMWHTLEMAQVLNTSSSSASGGGGGGGGGLGRGGGGGLTAAAEGSIQVEPVL